MKKSVGYSILLSVFVIAILFFTYVIMNGKKVTKQEFNIKVGDVLTFNDYDTTLRVLNVASTLCKDKKKCFDEGEVEVVVQAEYAGEKTNYTLKSNSNNIQRIKNSNNYLILKYENEKIEILIKDRDEI